MTSAAISERARRAHGGVRQALELWDATDLSKICQCQELIQRACDDLQAALDSGAGALPQQSRGDLAAIRSDTKRMIRLVDACSAFQRGLWLYLGNAAPEYRAQSAGSFDGSAAGSSGLEG